MLGIVDMNCLYCLKDITYNWRFVVQKAIAPAGKSYRWKTVGNCCEDCKQLGCKTTFEFGEEVYIPCNEDLISKATLIRASKLKW